MVKHSRMPRGYTGKIIFVDLTSGSIEVESLPEGIYRSFIGGAGLGVKILYERMKPNIDPLGPANIIGFIPGLLTGTPVPMGCRYTVVTKSPLTGTWGDANAGGYFGHELKAAGFDAIFFNGSSPKPVYLLVYKGKAELKDATHLWGKDTNKTEEIIRQEVGDRQVRIACIGPAGESLSLLASVINDGNRAAARSGVGAVMGAKKLKAVAVRGTKRIEIAKVNQFNELRKSWLKDLHQVTFLKRLGNYGTCADTSLLITEGATPIKNWSLFGSDAFPDYYKLAMDNVIGYQAKKSGCFGCPVQCSGIVNVKQGPYYVSEGGKPEYETLAGFGPMCFNLDVESIIKANDICNRYGIDTISVSTAIAFAMECYENGIIGKTETGGLELTWGNASAIVAMLEKIVRREGFGAVLADGVERAAKQIGGNAKEYAIHIHCQEPGYHAPRPFATRGLGYITDPTPGRHTISVASIILEAGGTLGTYPELKAPEVGSEYERKGEIHALGSSYTQTFCASGACLFAMLGPFPLIEFISAVTGWDITPAEAINTGRRIQTLRHAFNTREGLNPSDFRLPQRVAQLPSMGPYAGRIVDFDALRASYYKAMGWDVKTGHPLEKTLIELGLKELVTGID